jgi:hypothetical protein
MSRSDVILSVVGIALLMALAAAYMVKPACPEWAQKDVHDLYIDLADGTMKPGTIEYFGDRIGKAVNEIRDEECKDAYAAFGPNAITRNTAELRALAASFLQRWGGGKYQPAQ